MVKNLSVNSKINYGIKKNMVHNLVKNLKKDLEFDISSFFINFISREEIIDINKKFLKHNYYTDIITFNYSGNNNILDGEIFISVEDAEINAKRFNVNFNDEIIRLVIHGFLHLLGYDDKDRNKKIAMKKRENQLCYSYSKMFKNKYYRNYTNLQKKLPI